MSFSTDVMRELETVALVKVVRQLEPSFWKNHDDLAAIHFTTGRYELAASEYKLVATLTSDKTRVLNELGSAYFMAMALAPIASVLVLRLDCVSRTPLPPPDFMEKILTLVVTKQNLDV